MLLTTGLSKNLENVLLLAHPHMGAAQSPNPMLRVRAGYRAFLRSIQPDVPQVGKYGCGMVSGTQDIDSLHKIFDSRGDLLTDIKHEMSYDTIAREQREQVWQRILDALQLSPSFAEAFHLLVHSVFYVNSPTAGGGSISSAIGVVWLDPRPKWSRLDLYEALVHETTHNLMFLDERVEKHYDDINRLALPENLCLSAILRRKRPLDKVLHSLVVATEVLLHRERVIGGNQDPRLHPKTDEMLSQCFATIDAIQGNSAVCRTLSERGHELVATCKAHLLSLMRGASKSSESTSHWHPTEPPVAASV